MLRVNSISNVNNTLKSNISFRAGVQTNYGVQEKTPNLVEQGILTGFVGYVKTSLFGSKENKNEIDSRAESIKNGMDETKRLDMVA